MFRLSEDEPLGPLSILILILLDIFLLIVLYRGLSAQSGLLTYPDEYIPYICQNIIIEKEWTENIRIDKLSDIVISYHRYPYKPVERQKKIYPICEEIIDAIDAVKIDTSIIQLFEERSQLKISQDEIRNNLRKTGQLSEITNDQRYIELSNEIIKIDEEVNSNKNVIHLWNTIDSAMAKQEEVIEVLQDYRFFFPLYKTLFRFLFLLPLLILFYIWYRRSIESRLQGLISTHLLIVVSVPIFFEIVQFVLHIIPYQLIKRFIDLLEAIKLIALWYYIVIAIAVGISILLIYIFQKQLFNRGKVIEKRIRSRNCIRCGKKLPDNDKYCSSCGTVQFKTCPECDQLTYVNSNYCRECGKELKEEDYLE